MEPAGGRAFLRAIALRAPWRAGLFVVAMVLGLVDVAGVKPGEVGDELGGGLALAGGESLEVGDEIDVVG